MMITSLSNNVNEPLTICNFLSGVTILSSPSNVEI